MNKTYLTHGDVLVLVNRLIGLLYSTKLIQGGGNSLKVYPIPRGGVPVAYAMLDIIAITIVDTPEEADVFIDDIIDSGGTKRRYRDTYCKPTFALIDKTTSADAENYGWVVFPWENIDDGTAETAEANVTRLLQVIGEDPTREGLLETPARVLKAWRHWTKGYAQNASDILKVFEDGAEGYDEMIVVKDIPLYSKCEHHMADIFGTVTIAYIPNGRIVGLSKLSRLVDVFARRLQVQERLTSQIADSLNNELRPLGVGVLVKARHMCMESRGICQQGHHTITSALRGVIKDDPQARAEFLTLS